MVLYQLGRTSLKSPDLEIALVARWLSCCFYPPSPQNAAADSSPCVSASPARRLIREEGYQGLIIGLTGDTSLEDINYFKAHGADAVLPKPFVLSEFNRIVQEFLGKKKTKKTARDA